MKRRIVSLLVSVAMLVTLMPAVFAENTDGSYDGAYTAASGVTRAEWISSIVETFQMTVESDAAMPDNYFSDVTSDDSCYYDLLLAVEFGVIDIEAGEAFEPNKAVTREFAAQTLNFALGFRLDETQEYTYNESSDVSYPDDIQIAVNRGWFALSGGNFLPEREITAVEAAAMLADAKNVLSEEAVDENYNSTYEFAEGVIVVPETVETEINNDNTVVIYDNATGINKGDVFAVYTSGFPVAFTALEVEVSETKTVIQTTREGTDNAIDYVDCEGAIEVDVEDFQFEDYATYSITDTSKANAESEEMTVELSGVSYDEKSKTVNVSQKISVGDAAAGTVSIKVKNPKLVFKSKGGLTQVYVTADTSVTTSVSFDFGNYAGIPSSLILGAVPIAGIGTISLEIEYSLKGGVTLSWDGAVKAGFSVKGFDVKVIKSYTKKDFSFSAYAQIKAGVRLAVAYDVLFSKGVIYASVGVKAGIELHTYDSGTPKKCVTIKGHLYARIGMDVSVLGQSIPIEPYDIYDESNSPVRVVNHYEDDVAVSSCSRGHSLKYVTSPSSYYYNPSSPYGSGSYGGGGTVAPVVIWEYEVEDGNATITKYNGTASAVVIPSTLDGYTVNKDREATHFDNNKSIRSVAMANTITEIGSYAFENCSNLSSVVLSTSLRNIGGYAFSECISLDNIDMPNTVTSMGTYVFDSCTSLAEVKLSDSLLTIPKRAFSGCTSLKTIELPDAITSIAIYAFYNCKALESVVLPKSINSLGSRAFMNCTSLSYVKIPKKLDVCGFYEYEGLFPAYGGPFTGCTELNNVEFESGVTKIPQALFYSCDGLKEITIPDTVTTIGMYGLAACANLEKVNGMKSVTSIGTFAFQANYKLKEIELPKRLESMGAGAFRNCTSLEKITIPKTLKSAGYSYSIVGVGVGNAGVFAGNTIKEIYFEDGCTKVPNNLCIKATALEHIYFNSSMEDVGQYSFSECSSLKEIKFSDNITYVGEYAFNNCSAATSLHLNNGVQFIYEGAFSGCESITSASLPDTVSILETSAFRNCESLESVVLSKQLKGLASKTFENCSALDNVIIPDNITKINANCFSNCTSLSDIDIPYGVTSIGTNAFGGCAALKNITIPDSVTSIGTSCFSNCETLQYVDLGIGIKEIPSSAFEKCSELQKIIIPRYCEIISSNAFKEDVNLSEVTILQNVNSISDNAFSYPSRVTIRGVSGSYAETFAKTDEYTFKPISINMQELSFYKDELVFTKTKTSKVLPLKINTFG